MAEIIASEQLEMARKRALAAGKAYAGRPCDVKALREQADAAIGSFDRAAMKQIVLQAKAGVQYLKDEVTQPAQESLQAHHTAFICPDYESWQQHFESQQRLAILFRDKAKAEVALLTDIQGDIARTIDKAEDAYAAGKSADAAIDDLEVALKKAAAAMTAQHDKLGPPRDQAVAAAKARDAAALDKARGVFNAAFEAMEKSWRDGEALLREFAARHLKAAEITAGKRRALQAQFDAASKAWQPMEVLRDGAARWAKEVRDLALASVDGKKAATVLGFEAKNAGDVVQALQGDESSIRKKLEALAKKLGRRDSGRDLFDRLRKARLA